MTTHQKENKPHQAVQGAVSSQGETPTFDQWAGAVKQQMIASLKRKASN